ncbi:hypothetical protein T492DRAFT_1149772 [Pavlovales sp. CCMP2436]|nr:hypothetical protein T492DRAFT_1149772 [Pavlovales sp. CCMP2436]
MGGMVHGLEVTPEQAVGSRQWAAGSGQHAVGSRQWAAGSGQQAVGWKSTSSAPSSSSVHPATAESSGSALRSSSDSRGCRSHQCSIGRSSGAQDGTRSLARALAWPNAVCRREVGQRVVGALACQHAEHHLLAILKGRLQPQPHQRVLVRVRVERQLGAHPVERVGRSRTVVGRECVDERGHRRPARGWMRVTKLPPTAGYLVTY